MKRCFSIALILALLGTTLFLPAMADELEIVCEDIDSTDAEILEIDEVEFIFDGEEIAPGQTFTEAVEEMSADTPLVREALIDETDSMDDALETEVMAAETADETDSEEEKEKAVATGIVLSAETLVIGKDEKYDQLTVKAIPEGSTLPEITWRSKNNKIAKVNKSGVITGIKAGKSTTIYAKIAGTDTEVGCKVKVKKAPNKISIKPTKLTLAVGMSYQMSSSVPSGYGSATRKYKSRNKKIVTVDASGLVTAVSEGTTKISVKTFNGKKATCTVTVTAEPAYVEFPDSIPPLAIGQTITLDARAMTATGKETPSTITYSIDPDSPDAGCITIDESTGKITGVRAGTAIICATAHNGAIGRCTIEVDNGPKEIILNNTSIRIGVKEVYVGLMAELVPQDGSTSCAQDVSWSSSNKKIAKVDADTGAITGIKKGSCDITVEAPNGVCAKCTVTVLKAPTKNKISISPANGSLKVGQRGQYTVKLSSGYGGSFSYVSSNTDIATIDNSGIVTAIAPGKVVITVITYNNIKKKANLEVISDEETDPDDSKTGDQKLINYVISVARKKLGCKYVYGAFGPNTFDCSGFMYWCFKQINIKLKDSAYKQGYDNRFPKISYGNLKAGDMVFFNTVNDKDLSDHSGLYLGNGKFIHCSSSAGKVLISKMSSGYYKRNFSWGRRVIK